jgi:uncharacterized protein
MSNKRASRTGRLSLKHVFALFSFIFVVWAVYRYLPPIIPAWAEELILKPIVWLVPTFWLIGRVEKSTLSSIGLTMKNFFPSVYWGLGLGVVFVLEGLMTNIFKYKGLNLGIVDLQSTTFMNLLLLSWVTAFSEEVVFRGYIFNRLWQIWGDEWLANILSSFLFVLIHLPLGIFTLGYAPMILAIYLFFVFIYAFGSAFVFARSQNLVSSIILHVLWSWPIILFR